MASIRDKSTIEIIAKTYCSNGRIKSLALQGAGYSKLYSERAGLKLFDNVQLIATIARIDAKTERKLDLSRAKQHAKLEQAQAMAIETHSPSAMVSAIREQNEMLGYHRDKSPNQEREQSLTGRITAEEQRILLECADVLLRKQVVSTDTAQASCEAREEHNLARPILCRGEQG